MGLTRKQKEVFDYIKDYIDENSFSPTQKEIKEHFGLKSFGSVQRYIKYLMDFDMITNDDNARRGLTIVSANSSNIGSNYNTPSNMAEIPLLGKVAAGAPILAIEDATETINIPAGMTKGSHQYFALKVVGDSMIEDGILEDDVIVCKHQKNANIGDRVVALIDGEATLKIFQKKKNHIELIPANSRLKPILVDPKTSEFKIVGTLVGLLRSYA